MYTHTLTQGDSVPAPEVCSSSNAALVGGAVYKTYMTHSLTRIRVQLTSAQQVIWNAPLRARELPEAECAGLNHGDFTLGT